MAAPKFEPGQHILYRGPHVDDSGKTGPPVICDVKPVIVVEDTPTLISLFLPAQTETLMSRGIVSGLRKPWSPGEWELAPGSWDRWHTLFLIVPGEWRATWVWWLPGWTFYGWYVNFQEPLWRTRWGFDIRDLQLDIVVAPDLAWRWKDEDEFVRGEDQAIFSEEHVSEVRKSAEATIRLIEGRAAPFDDTYVDWRPEPLWAKPQLPTGTALAEVLKWSPSDAIERCLAPTANR